MTRNLRKAASSTGNAEFLPMWAGQGLTLARPMPAAELVNCLLVEAEKLLSSNRASTSMVLVSELVS